MQIDIEEAKKAIGNQRIIVDDICKRTARLMQATLNKKPSLRNGDELPALWHWLYFHEPIVTEQLDKDGHEKLGQFLPALPLDKRMWAGSRFKFYHPFIIGQQVSKQSTVVDIKIKQGKSGLLCFVTIEHLYFESNRLICSEEQDVVYKEREAKKEKEQQNSNAAINDAPLQSLNQTSVVPNKVLLFRYSALTFNAHRIHYDFEYTSQAEDYPRLVFHGPLTATLMLDFVMSNYADKRLASFQFRGVSPLFDNKPFKISYNKNDAGLHIWASNPNDKLAMTADVTFFKSN